MRRHRFGPFGVRRGSAEPGKAFDMSVHAIKLIAKNRFHLPIVVERHDQTVSRTNRNFALR